MSHSYASRFEQLTVQQYARQARMHLPAEAFQLAPGRLLWLPVHLTVIVAAAAFVVTAAPPWYLCLLCAVISGHSWTCLAFLAHETLHHAVVKSRLVERLVGYCGLGIFCLSPTLWTAWHNQEHHGNAGNPDADPDVLGTMLSWRTSSVDRAFEKLAPGSGYLRSAAFFFFTFSVHSAVVLLSHSRRDGYYARISRRVVYAESAVMLAFWIGVFLVVGGWSFLFVYVVPVLIANAVAMSYIATNHFLNSMTSINDPLVNSLSVTAPRWVEALHLHFGYHVEHHVFPPSAAVTRRWCGLL